MKSFKHFIVENFLLEEDQTSSTIVSSTKTDEEKKAEQKAKQDAAKQAALGQIRGYLDGLSKKIKTTYEAGPNQGIGSNAWDSAAGNLSVMRNEIKDIGVSPVLDAEAKKVKDVPLVGDVLSDIVGSEMLKRFVTQMGLRSAPWPNPIPSKLKDEDIAFLDNLKQLQKNPNLTASQLAIALHQGRNPKLNPRWTVSPPPPKASSTPPASGTDNK